MRTLVIGRARSRLLSGCFRMGAPTASPPTNVRATRARSARPASVTLSRTASPAISDPTPSALANFLLTELPGIARRQDAAATPWELLWSMLAGAPFSSMLS